MLITSVFHLRNKFIFFNLKFTWDWVHFLFVKLQQLLPTLSVSELKTVRFSKTWSSLINYKVRNLELKDTIFERNITSRSFKNSWVFLENARSENPSSSSSWSMGSTTTGLNEEVRKKHPSVQRRIAAWAPGLRTNSTTPSFVDWPRSFAITMARSI